MQRRSRESSKWRAAVAACSAAVRSRSAIRPGEPADDDERDRAREVGDDGDLVVGGGVPDREQRDGGEPRADAGDRPELERDQDDRDDVEERDAVARRAAQLAARRRRARRPRSPRPARAAGAEDGIRLPLPTIVSIATDPGLWTMVGPMLPRPAHRDDPQPAPTGAPAGAGARRSPSSGRSATARSPRWWRGSRRRASPAACSCPATRTSATASSSRARTSSRAPARPSASSRRSTPRAATRASTTRAPAARGGRGNVRDLVGRSPRRAARRLGAPPRRPAAAASRCGTPTGQEARLTVKNGSVFENVGKKPTSSWATSTSAAATG